MWSFRRGVDWAGDPTGATALALNCFVDGLEGSDVNTGLNPLLPCKTLAQAKLNGGTFTINVAPYIYTDELGGVGAFEETFSIIGDSEDEDVVFLDSLGVLDGVGSKTFENLVLTGYLNGARGISTLNCSFVDCGNCEFKSVYGCRFINSAVSNLDGVSNSFYSCAFLNSPVLNDGSQPTLITGCYIDSSSTLNRVVASALTLTASHFEDKTTWDIAGVTYNVSSTDGDPFINDADLLNYTFDPLLSPLFGRGYPDGFSNPRHMARYYIGNGFYSGLTSFDAKIAANANLDVVANELLNVGPNDLELLETDEIILDSLQAIGSPQKVGILTYLSTVFGLSPSAGNLDRVLEIRYSSTVGGALSTYQKYRFGEQATNNGGGLGNGETGYNWADNNPIFVKKYQFRIGVVKGGVI